MADGEETDLVERPFDVDSKLKDFRDILSEIDGVSDKKKQLYLEIYENAICDRQNAYVMFERLASIVERKSNEHAVHGRTMATYIEKMSKSNDQLIKLAEIITKSNDGGEKPIDPEEMFSKISGKK